MSGTKRKASTSVVQHAMRASTRTSQLRFTTTTVRQSFMLCHLTRQTRTPKTLVWETLFQPSNKSDGRNAQLLELTRGSRNLKSKTVYAVARCSRPDSGPNYTNCRCVVVEAGSRDMVLLPCRPPNAQHAFLFWSLFIQKPPGL